MRDSFTLRGTRISVPDLARNVLNRTREPGLTPSVLLDDTSLIVAARVVEPNDPRGFELVHVRIRRRILDTAAHDKAEEQDGDEEEKEALHGRGRRSD